MEQHDWVQPQELLDYTADPLKYPKDFYQLPSINSISAVAGLEGIRVYK